MCLCALLSLGVYSVAVTALEDTCVSSVFVVFGVYSVAVTALGVPVCMCALLPLGVYSVAVTTMGDTFVSVCFAVFGGVQCGSDCPCYMTLNCNAFAEGGPGLSSG